MSQPEVLEAGRSGIGPDVPATAYRLLPTGPTVVIALLLLGLAALAWWATARRSGSMSDMVNGLGEVGRRMPNDMTLVPFMGMWAAMMTAMMSPSVIPITLAHRSMLRRRGEGAAPTAAFVVGFLAVWALIGLAYFVPFLWYRDLAAAAGDSRWLPTLAGAILVVAGGYQFTPRKAHCQRSCCAPQAFVRDHDAGAGLTGGFRSGVRHGVHCLGCCWALMTVLLVVGLMNLVWMAGISLLFLAEKHSLRALRLGQMAGVALVALGLVVIARPSVLHTISSTTDTPAPMAAAGR